MNNYKIEIKWAMIFVIVGLLWMYFEKFVGLHSTHIDKQMIYTNFFSILAVAVYIFALIDKRKNYFENVMSFKQGFISGLIITGIVTLLSPLSQIITSLVITPEYFPNVISYVVEHGMMTQESAENQFNLQNYIITGLIFAAITGIVTSAIVAAIVQKKPKSTLEIK